MLGKPAGGKGGEREEQRSKKIVEVSAAGYRRKGVFAHFPALDTASEL